MKLVTITIYTNLNNDANNGKVIKHLNVVNTIKINATVINHVTIELNVIMVVFVIVITIKMLLTLP